MPGNADNIIFKTVPGFERYVVGTDGSVWSSFGRQRKRLKLLKNANGYFRVYLYGNGRVSRPSIHRLVLTVFVGPCPEGMECCHGPNGKADNSLSNLRWDTHRANTLERETKNKGQTHHNSKLTDDAVLMIQCLLNNGFTYQTLAAEFGVTTGVIWRIKTGRRKTRIPELVVKGA